ncbi:MAG: helix-turn-helix transcriptional regulator [Halothiobacillaceae bacterium]
MDKINDLRRKHIRTPEGLVPFLLELREVCLLLHTSPDTIKSLVKAGEFPQVAPFSENPDGRTKRWRSQDIADWLHSRRRINDHGCEIPDLLK